MKKRSLLLAAVTSLLAMVPSRSIFDGTIPIDRRSRDSNAKRRKTHADLARMKAAEAKRARKAARRSA